MKFKDIDINKRIKLLKRFLESRNIKEIKKEEYEKELIFLSNIKLKGGLK